MSILPFEDGMDYGVGFDSLSHKIRGDSVIRTSPETVLGGGGPSVLFSLDMVESHSQLTEQLNVSASASLGNALIGGGSLQAQFASEHSIDDYSVYLLVQVHVVNAHKRMRDVRLNDDAWKLMEKQGPDAFRKRYGDEFVVGVTTGGYFGGFVQIHTAHAEDKTNISASLRASGGLGSWSAGGDFQTAIGKISSSYDCTIKTFQQGGAKLEPPSDIPTMGQKAIQFADSVGSTGTTYYVETLDYTALPLPEGKNPIDVQNQLDVLRQLAEYRSRLYDRLGSVQYAQDHPDQFDNLPDNPTLNNTIAMLSNHINAVYRAATSCFSDYTTCQLLTDMSMPAMITLPKQKKGEALPPPPVTVPSFVGMEYGAAKAAASALSLGIKSAFLAGGQRDIVVDQFPTAGTPVPSGSTITVRGNIGINPAFIKVMVSSGINDTVLGH